MAFFETMFNSPQGRIILSIIWGLGLAAMFRKVCSGRSCIVIRGPSPAEMENKVYAFNDKCYTYKAENTSCSTSTHTTPIPSKH